MTGRDILGFFLIAILLLFYYLFQDPKEGLEKSGKLLDTVFKKIRELVRWAENL